MIFFEKKSKKLFFFEKLFCARFEGAGAPEEETVAELGAVQCSKKQNRSFYTYF
jgi:hypothetical protein